MKVVPSHDNPVQQNSLAFFAVEPQSVASLFSPAQPPCSLRFWWKKLSSCASTRFLAGEQTQSASSEQDVVGSFEHVPGPESVGALKGLADGDLLGLDVGVDVGERDGALDGLAVGDCKM